MYSTGFISTSRWQLDTVPARAESGEARLHITVKLANGPKETSDAVEEQMVRGALADTHGNVTFSRQDAKR